MKVQINDNDLFGIDMGPLIDCVFLLLIFFLVATTLKKPTKEELIAPVAIEEETPAEELPIELPDPAVSSGPAQQNNPLILSIDQKGQFYLYNLPVNKNEIHQKIRQLALNNPNQHIRIDVDRHAASQDLIYVLDLCAYEGLKDYAIHTMRKNIAINN